MNKHEKARKKLVIVTNYLTKLFEDCPEEIGDLEDYINSCEATENELSTCKIERSLNEKMYEELKRDVKRFLYLQTGRISITGEFREDFVERNKTSIYQCESVANDNLKVEYRLLQEKLSNEVTSK